MLEEVAADAQSAEEKGSDRGLLIAYQEALQEWISSRDCSWLLFVDLIDKAGVKPVPQGHLRPQPLAVEHGLSGLLPWNFTAACLV